jgi:hypothetical protein
MFLATGQVINVFKSSDFKDRSTGEITPGKSKIQILGDFPQSNGEVRKQLVDFSVDDRSLYDILIGAFIRVPISVFCNNNQVVFFIPKGSIPEPVNASDDQKSLKNGLKFNASNSSNPKPA